MSTIPIQGAPPELPEYFYLPWTDGEHNLEQGAKFAKDLGAAAKLPLRSASRS